MNLADLSDEQRTAALRVLDALLSDEGYATVTGIMGGDEYLAGDGTEVQQIAASLDETYVNWSGATTYDMTQGDGIYFQISGPDVYIEFAAQQGSAGADVDGVTTSGWGHVHTIYRDPTGDYAGSVTQQAAAGLGSGGPGGGQPPVGAGPTRGYPEPPASGSTSARRFGWFLLTEPASTTR